MEWLHEIGNWVWGILSAFAGYLFYQHKRMDGRVDLLESRFHALDKSQIALHVELSDMKEDIRELKKSIDRLIERLYDEQSNRRYNALGANRSE